MLVITSCGGGGREQAPSSPERAAGAVSTQERDALKAAFAQALATALAHSPGLRHLVKHEALKMFDRDYDVLYLAIRDQPVARRQTVRDLLLSHLGRERLDAVEAQLPLLTIFVPSLPNDSFSALSWNADLQIPWVGVTSQGTRHVDIMGGNGERLMLPTHQIPAFPVVVVKENERLIPVAGQPLETPASAPSKGLRAGGTDFRFLASSFDGSVRSSQESAQAIRFYQPDPKLVEAYSIYQESDGWHRDYVYYGITPTQTHGPFSYDFQEHITSFRLKGDPVAAYSKIADQTGDAGLVPSFVKPCTGWTDGFYEFKVRVLLNAKNGIGQVLETYFSATPEDLFSVVFKEETFERGWILFGSRISFYTPEVTGLKTMPLSLPLFAWDLNDYASTVKIEIEEVDTVETMTVTDTNAVTFANNFEIKPSTGVLEKVGLKFGASLQTNRTQTLTKNYTLGNDVLGSVIVNFADSVLLEHKNWLLGYVRPWSVREYETGWYGIVVEPARIQ